MRLCFCSTYDVTISVYKEGDWRLSCFWNLDGGVIPCTQYIDLGKRLRASCLGVIYAISDIESHFHITGLRFSDLSPQLHLNPLFHYFSLLPGSQ